MSEAKGKLLFSCPHCGQKLSFLDGTLVKLAGRLHAETFSCKAMFYIPAKLGEYGAIVGEGVRIKEGARVEFECINGACKHNFTSSHDPDLAEVLMTDQNGRKFAVVFNKVFGKRSTYLVDFKRHELLESFGEDADLYAADFDKPRNYFGA